MSVNDFRVYLCIRLFKKKLLHIQEVSHLYASVLFFSLLIFI